MSRVSVRLLLFVGFWSLFVHTTVVAHGRVAAAQRFRVEPALCRTIACPPWITRSDVETIRRDSGLLAESLPGLSPESMERIAEGHARSGWVRRVVAVRAGFPNRAVVALELRKPLAGVLVNGRDIVLLDEEGVRLPGLYREPPSGLGYPLRRIDGVRGAPPAPGERWSAAAIEGAAVAKELLALPADVLRAIPILTIDVADVADGGPVTLTTAGGVAIEWGRSAAHEYGCLGPSLADKVRKLTRALGLRPALAGFLRVKLQFSDLVVEEAGVSQGV